MKILTFNVRNRYGIKNYNGMYKGINTINNLSDYVKSNDIDIIALQEVVESYRDNLTNALNTYYVYGKPRLGSNIFTRKIDKLKRFNESANIYTKEEALKCMCYKLPNLPDLLPRVATLVEYKLDNKEITIINVHLSAYNKISKNRQLKYLYKKIKHIKTPIILLGDFNMNIKSNIMNKFIDKLSNLGINHLEIKGRTFKKSKRNLPIDHVFISNSLKVNNIEKVKDEIVSFSDHYPVLIDFRGNNNE